MQKPIALLIPFLFACETLYRARGKIVTAGDAVYTFEAAGGLAKMRRGCARPPTD